MERDDEGLGTNSNSLMNGNARTPLACCTIGRTSPNNWASPWSETELNAAADAKKARSKCYTLKSIFKIFCFQF